MKVLRFRMTWMSALVVVLSAWVTLSGSISVALPLEERLVALSSSNVDSTTSLVVIDTSDPAYTIFTRIPEYLDKDKIEKIKQKGADRDTLRIIPWKTFLDCVDECAQSVVLRDDYPDIQVVDGLVSLIGSPRGTGAPWGLTWNNGIAFSRTAYEHAKQAYAAYMTDPLCYEPIRDPALDPVHPEVYFSFGRH